MSLDDSSRPPVDRMEFWIRFVCGASAGAFAALALVVKSLARASIFRPSTHWIAISAVVLILGSGLGAAYGGDRFWYRLLGRRD